MWKATNSLLYPPSAPLVIWAATNSHLTSDQAQITKSLGTVHPLIFSPSLQFFFRVSSWVPLPPAIYFILTFHCFLDFVSGTCCPKWQLHFCLKRPSEYAFPKANSLFVGHSARASYRKPKSLCGYFLFFHSSLKAFLRWEEQLI